MTVLEAIETTELAERWQSLCERAAAIDLVPDNINPNIVDGLTKEQLDDAEALLIKEEARAALGIREMFCIDSQERLEWLMKERLHLNAEIEAIKLQYSRLLRAAQGRLEALEALFKGDARAFVESTGKTTINTPYGNAQLKKQPAKWVIECEEDLQQWCAEADDDLKAKLSIVPKVYNRDLDAIRDYCTSVQTIPGLKYEEATIRFDLTILKPKGEK